ncbi:MAG: SdpI family protein [Dehalococcoidia bacterium]|jgi:uncharacterized membrane protein
MKVSWRSEIVPLLLIAAMFVLAVIAWPDAPDRIPIHWGLSGEPDNYAGKVWGLFGPPVIAAGIYTLFFIMPRIDPRKRNYERFWSKYLIIRTVIITVLAAIHVVTFLWAIGTEVNMNIMVPMIIGFLLVLIGNYLGKLRSTWFVGIRSPWTLSSEESWNKTHRLGGWVFVIFGLALVIVAPFQEKWAFYAWGITGAAALVFLYAYSYFVWKKDPDARPVGTRASHH